MLAVHELELLHVLYALTPSLFKRSQVILKVQALEGALMGCTCSSVTLLKIGTQQVTYANTCTGYLVCVCGAYAATCCSNLV